MAYNEIPLPGFEPEQGYRATNVANLLGITYRQLDNWTTSNLVRASARKAQGSGTQRLYSYDDILRLKVICRLKGLGITMQAIRKAMEAIDSLNISLGDVTVVGDQYGNIHAVDSQDHVVDLLKNGQGAFFISIDPIIKETDAEIVQLTPEQVFTIPPVDLPDFDAEAI